MLRIYIKNGLYTFKHSHKKNTHKFMHAFKKKNVNLAMHPYVEKKYNGT